MASVFPPIAWRPAGQGVRWQPAAIVGGGAASIVIACLLAGGLAALPIALALLIGAAGGAAAVRILVRAERATPLPGNDPALLRAALEDDEAAVAITDRDGALLCANRRYLEHFGLVGPQHALREEDADPGELARAARRDGVAELHGLRIGGQPSVATLRRGGQGEGQLVWRLAAMPAPALGNDPAGDFGERLAVAGVMLVVATPDGRIAEANSVFRRRALGHDDGAIERATLPDLLSMDPEGVVRILREAEEGADATALRVIAMPRANDGGETAFLLLDADADAELASAALARTAATGQLHDLLAMLPLGLALAERDGRMLFMNAAFQRAAMVQEGETILFPSDLVTDEDKATVIEAVRRFAQGRALPGDLNVRLKHKPDEPVALTIANAQSHRAEL